MPESDRLQALTERERRYLRLVLAHRTSKEIAREEGLSKHTVDLHIHRAVRKLGARSRREAALIAAGDTPPYRVGIRSAVSGSRRRSREISVSARGGGP